jgi:hydrogenase expression/formation protein HypC
MKVVKIDGAEGMVEAGGLKRRANFILMKGVRTGDYVLLHAGFAIERIKPEEAKKTLGLLKEL